MNRLDLFAGPIRSLADDVLYAARSLKRHPIFSGFVVSIVACGFALSISAIGLLNRLLIDPPAGVRDPDRLARVVVHWSSSTDSSAVRGLLTSEEFERLEAYAQPPLGLFAYTPPESVTAVFAGRPRKVTASLVSPDYFEGLRVEPLIGSLAPDSLLAGGSGIPGAIVSNMFWQQNRSTQSVIGNELRIRGIRFRIVGVTGDDFHGLDIGATDVWLPRQGGAVALGDPRDAARPDAYIYHVMARLPGTMDLDPLARHFSTAIDARASLLSISAARRIDVGESSFVVFVAVVSIVVMLLSIVAAMNLLIMRSLKRAKEYAIWSAVGAPPARVIRAILLEIAAVLALVAVTSVVLAPRVAEAFRARVTPELYHGSGWWDGRSAGLLLTGLVLSFAVSAIMPVRAALSPQVWSLLAEHPLKTTFGARRQLLAAQVTMSFLLIAGGGLFIQSFRRALSNTSGIDYRGLYYISFSRDGIAEAATRGPPLQTFLEQVKSIPGVEAAGISNSLPSMSQTMVLLRLPDRRPFPIPRGGGPYLNVVTPDFLSLMGTSMVRGRTFTSGDTLGAPPVAVVNETMAEAVWPNGDAIGKCFNVLLPPVKCYRVVGVARNTRTTELRSMSAMQYYLTFAQSNATEDVSFLLVRLSKPSEATLSEVEGILTGMQLSKHGEFRSLSELVEPDVAPLRLAARFLTVFGALALFFSVAGIYGIVTHSLWSQRKELGIRMSLGGSPRRLLIGVLADTAKLTGVGLVVGAALAIALFPLVRSLLFATGPYDPLSFATAFALVLVSALSAGAVGAWRYLRLEPARLMTMP